MKSVDRYIGRQTIVVVNIVIVIIITGFIVCLLKLTIDALQQSKGLGLINFNTYKKLH